MSDQAIGRLTNILQIWTIRRNNVIVTFVREKFSFYIFSPRNVCNAFVLEDSKYRKINVGGSNVRKAIEIRFITDVDTP